MTSPHQELAFQDEIASYLEAHGWLRSQNSAGYDKERAVFPEDLLGWLEETDADNFHKIVPDTNDETARARGEQRILDRVAKRLAQPPEQNGGTLGVLRHGFDIPGARRFTMLQQPPADNRNDHLLKRFAQNRLRVVQEVGYSTRKTDRIDLVLFVNGLPVATIELKTDFTQSLNNAKEQYKKDRLPAGEPLLTEFRGALVHFAVTDSEIAMTTKLNGDVTTFLPFNRGNRNGAGNEAVEGKARTAYFWEDVLERDAWLHILTKFIYINHQTSVDAVTGEIISKRHLRFPRYHQWRAVTKLTRHAREHGTGQNYLIQHSAGSGKTDSIAWTAHRMAALHTTDGTKVFDGVIVIADRQVLDRQLQDAVDQLVNATGTFQAITRGSEGSKTKQLVEALTSGVPIIGVTLQTFPYALRQIRDEGGELAGKRYAVIADEAHSSQTGDSANALRELLYTSEAPASLDEEPGADQDALIAMAAHNDADNRISFFAFTATPKAKTLETFGTRVGDGFEPFDLYSMKQAIEEGFILDVLKNYTTYDFAARIARRNAEGEETSEDFDRRTGTRALIGLVELHPTNVTSKVDVILDHFTSTVQHELGGRAKAMVVTSSRAAAVKYSRAFTKRIAQRGLSLKTLVAFSGSVDDPDVTPMPGVERPQVTEASMNPDLRGGDLAAVFGQSDQHILIVANKYQTGFDQPLLVAMYVDKQLSGIAAVQTLSRLNRRYDGKLNTYVLDFVNDREAVLEAFQTYYEDASIEQNSDPDLVSDLRAKLEAQNIYTYAEVDQVWATWTNTRTREVKHTKLGALLAPAFERFKARWRDAVTVGDTEAREVLEDFRSTLSQYVKSYAFFSQILHYGDPHYEKLSVFADLLARLLRSFTADEPDAAPVDVSDIVLTHYKLERVREDDLELVSGEGEGLRGLTEAGLSKARERARSSKDELIEVVNKYLGDLDELEEYKVSGIETMKAELRESSELQVQARNNLKVDFGFSPLLVDKVQMALWRQGGAQNRIRDAMQRMPHDQLINMLLDAGLYEELRELDDAV